jgi:Flp pilus assembly protein TadG
MKTPSRRSAGRQNRGVAAVRTRERGDTLVEHAFVIVLLLTVIFSIFDFGRAMYTYHFVSNIAREATRWASVRGASCAGLSGGCPALDTDVQNFASNIPAGMGLDPKKITATATWVAPPNNSPACVANSKNPGCVVKVQVTYPYKFFLPFMPSTTMTMTSTSQMVISQ